MKNIEIATHKSPTLWVLVADGKQASIYTLGSEEKVIPLPGSAKQRHFNATTVQTLIEVEGMRWQAQSAEEYQVGRNATGMVFESAGGARNMSEPHIDARREVKEHFASRIADEINRARAKKFFDQLVVIAPPQMLGELRAHFNKETGAAIKAELSKELTQLSPRDLLAHLQENLPI
ncbi:MAG: host attachment protein [Alphaproteobacteria bacterium]